MSCKPKSNTFAGTKRYVVCLDVAFADKKRATQARKTLEQLLEEVNAKFYVLALEVSEAGESKVSG